VTAEAHAEGTKKLGMAGAGVVVNVANLGTVNVAAAGSTMSGQAGKQLSVGAQRVGRQFSLGASATFGDRTFNDIATVNGDAVLRREITANAGLSLGWFGSLGVAYTGIDRDPTTQAALNADEVRSLLTNSVNGVYYVNQATRAHILSLSYSVPFGDVMFFGTGYHDFASNQSAVLFGLSVALGGRTTASVSVGSGSTGAYGQVQAVRSADSVGDWGYQAYGTTGHPAHEFAELEYKSPWALLSAGGDRNGHQTTPRVEAQGALALADGTVFATNTIDDSFAVVDTNGMENIRVLSENREVGRTDSSGKLLVPELRSFEVNRLAIDPTDVPADVSISTPTREVRPQDQSGVVVNFDVHVSHGAVVHLVDPAGLPLPIGSAATLKATGAAIPVGYGGLAYVEGLSSHNSLAVERPDGHRCTVTFDYSPHAGDIPTIGPLRCEEKRP